MEYVERMSESAISLVLLCWWFIGIAVTTGGWAVLAVVFPPYGMYKAVEFALIAAGLL